MIRILELIDGGFAGGGQTHILSLISRLDRNEFQTVTAASAEGPFGAMVAEGGSRFREITLGKIYRGTRLKELDNIVREEEIDIIHSHGGVAGMYARFHRKKFGSVPVVHTIHGIHYVNSGNPFRKFFTHSIDEHLASFADRYICVSKSDREKAEELNIIIPDRTTVIGNGIELSRFFRTGKDPVFMKLSGISENDLVLGLVSRFDVQKNQKFIIRNCAKLLKENQSLRILLAGGGKYLDSCKQAAMTEGISDRVIFTGEVIDPENYYPLIDIFIFPTLWEGLSIALIEAMASGRCILASDIPANRELITNGVNGLLFNLANKSDFTEKLELLILSPELRQKLSAASIHDSVKYSSKTMADSISEIYKELSYR